MKKRLVFILLLFFSFPLLSQSILTELNLSKIDTNTFHFQIDSLDGLKIKNSKSVNSAVIFIQGSSLEPILLNRDKEYLLTLGDFILDPNSDTYLMSKPGIPIKSNFNCLDSNYRLLNEYKDMELFHKKHRNEYYQEKYSALIDILYTSKVYDTIKIVGVSEGGRIAAFFINDIRVSEINILSSDPMGRVNSIIAKELNSNNPNLEKINFYYSLLVENEQNTDLLHRGYTHMAWRSFSTPFYSKLLQTKQKVNIVYGTEDRECYYCYLYDMMPHYNSQITVHKMEGYTHTFMRNGENMNSHVYRLLFE